MIIRKDTLLLNAVYNAVICNRGIRQVLAIVEGRNVHGSTIHNGHKVATAQVCISGWMDTHCVSTHSMSTHSTEYYSAMKRALATMWMDIEDLVLGESQTQKATHCRSHRKSLES